MTIALSSFKERMTVMIEQNSAVIRSEMQRLDLAALLVPRADEHLGEYVPPSAERLAWLTGFTGSAGLAVVLPTAPPVHRRPLRPPGRGADRPRRCGSAGTSPRSRRRPGWPQTLPQGAGDRLRPAAARARRRWRGSRDAGCRWCRPPANPSTRSGATGRRRPRRPAQCRTRWRYAGSAVRPEKRAEIAAPAARGQAGRGGADRPGLDRPGCSTCAGEDVPFTPFALGFAAAARRRDRRPVHGPGEAAGDDAGLARQRGAAARPPARAGPRRWADWPGKRVRVDPAGAPAWFAQRLRARRGRRWSRRPIPCLLPKAAQERGRAGRRPRRRIAATRWRCAASCIGWTPTPEPQTEMDRGRAAAGFRRELPDFRGESFPAISGAGENGAIIHYRVSAGDGAAAAAGRALPDRFRRPIRLRHHRRHPHRLARPGRPAGGVARPGHAGPARAHRDRDARVSRAAPPGPISTPSPAGRCGRRGSTTTTAPATASAASCRCMKAR